MTHGPVGDSSSGLDYEETEHAGRVIRIASVAALGGLLFGYDSAVINGAVSAIQDHFQVDNATLGFAVASALLGCVFGALTAGRLADRIGRLHVMKIAALLFFISAIGAGLANSVWLIVVFRIIGGIGVGVASVIAPAYIAETSPPRIRGRLGSLQQLAIVSGIFLSLAIDYGLAQLAGGSREELWLGLEAWRWMFLVMAVPAVVYGGLAFTIPESPRYLVAQYRIPEARRVLSMLLGEKNLEITITRIQESLKAEKPPSWRDLRKPTGGLYGIVWVGLGLSIFQQFVGINVIFYYCNVLWEAVGFTEKSSFVITVITSITNIADHADRDRADRQGRAQAAAAGRIDGHGGHAGHHGGDFRQRRPVVDGKPVLGDVAGPDRTDRGQPVRGGVRHVMGAGGVGAAGRDVPQPHPGGRAGPGRRGPMGGELGDHCVVPCAARARSASPTGSTRCARCSRDSSCGDGSRRPRACTWRTCIARRITTRHIPPGTELPRARRETAVTLLAGAWNNRVP